MNVEPIIYYVDKDQVSGTLYVPEKPNGQGILFIHGWGSSKAGYVERAEALCCLGYHCLTFDLRGFGESDGDFALLSQANHLEDVKASYDTLAKYITDGDVSVVGTSYGGYMAVLLSRHRPIESLVLRAPGIYKDSIYDKTGWSHEDLLLSEIHKFQKVDDFSDSQAMDILHTYMGSILVIGGEQDVKIPSIVVEEYYKEAMNTTKKKLIWMKNADHPLSSTDSKKEFVYILVDWFERELKR